MDESLNIRFRHRRKVIVYPLLWPADIPPLLGCQFGEINTTQSHSRVVNAVEDGLAVTGPDSSKQVERLRDSKSPLIKKACMENILKDGRLYTRCKRPRFRIIKQLVHETLCILFSPTEKHHVFGDLPMLGYIDYKDIQIAREQQNRRALKPDFKYYDRLKRITPPDWLEDPYIMCILLSVAQRQYKNSPRTAAYRSCLLVTNAACPDDIYLFDSKIAASLLDQLDDPSAKPKDVADFIINRTKIDLDPFTNLRARILAALSSQSSALGSNYMTGVKRRRDGDLDESCKRQKA